MLVAGLARGSTVHPSPAAVEAALDGADVVVVDNLFSLPLNEAATAVVAGVLAGRPAVVRHHDLPWQRQTATAAWGRVPDDPHWAHVTINSRSRRELGARQGLAAATLPNRFPLQGWLAPQDHDGRVLLHPVRAIPRKDIPAALALAEAVDATYWLTGDAEDGYGPELARVLSGARTSVRRAATSSSAEAYAACDAVVFPSRIEGFGNPVIESALARRPLAVRRYQVLVDDLEPLGFRWFAHDDSVGLARYLDEPDPSLLDDNEALAREHFGLDLLPQELSAVLERVL